MSARDVTLQFVALALAFGVGVLLGARSCSTAEVETVTETVVETSPERIVYQCPPDAGVAETTSKTDRPARAAVGSSRDKQLPDAPPAITPRQRQRLLAWVRDQSADLEGCRTADKETFRMSVTLELDGDGGVAKARLNAPQSEVPSSIRGCLRQRMANWEPPAELVEGQKTLVFGLTL